MGVLAAAVDATGAPVVVGGVLLAVEVVAVAAAWVGGLGVATPDPDLAPPFGVCGCDPAGPCDIGESR